MESDDLDNLEEELYSKIYHDSNSPDFQTADFIIDSSVRKSSGGTRYYQENSSGRNSGNKQKHTQRFIKPRKFQNLPPKSNDSGDSPAQDSQTTPKTFAPYSSVLFTSALRNESNAEIEALKDIIVPRNQPASSTVLLGDDKKPPHAPLRNNNNNNNSNSSSSHSTSAVLKEEKAFTSPCKKIMKLSKKTKAKQQRQQSKLAPELIEIVSSDDDSSVIYIETPAPPLIALESSSDDDGVKKKKRVNKTGGGSPSTSSIISDDFIVRSDKSRLKNIFHTTKQHLNNIPVVKTNRQHIYDEDTSNDSIYNTKLLAMNRLQGSNSNSLNHVTAKLSSKARPRESSEEEEEEEDVGIIAKRNEEESNESAEMLTKEKRLRYDEMNYNETDFSSLITNAIVQKSNEDDKSQKKSGRRKSSTSKCELVDENALIVENCDLILNVSSQSDTPRSDGPTVTIDLSQQHESKPESLGKFVNAAANQQIDCEVGWNDEMRYFYNEYSYGRDFSITNVRSFMPCGDWKINTVDRTVVVDQHCKKIRCRNCNEIGHKSFQCYRPKKKIICFMCGEVGHVETRCPKALCLRCGKSTTRFTTMCNSCSKFNKKRCPICKSSFHDLDQCPDKWRRYHSTTTENNTVLDIECMRNERVYCSVCAKQGHFADSCIYFNKQKDGYIASGWFAISNKPSYSSTFKFDIDIIQSNQVLNLLTYMKTYFFNLKLPSNCQFYPRFRQRFLEEKYGSRFIECAKEDDEKEQEEEECTKETERENGREENFKTPLSSGGDSAEAQQNGISSAKILVNFHHKQILTSQKIQIETLGAKFNIAIKFPEQVDQKHLFILGTSANQSLFQRELRELFWKCELARHQEMFETSTQLPKTISKIVDRVRSNLQMIKYIGIRDAKRTLESFLRTLRVFDGKNHVKFRRNLNIVFMGYGELREGATHLRELRKILMSLEKQVLDGNGNNQLEQNLKDKLSGHLKYIFSPIDHGNYLQLFRNYKQVVMQKQTKKNTKNN